MAKLEKPITANFKTSAETLRKFNAEVKLRGFFNKDIFNAFLNKFNANPQKTIEFLEIATKNEV